MQAKVGDGVLIAGIIGKDASCKEVGQNLDLMCKFGVKVGEKKSLDPNGKPETIWVNCVAWRKTAERCRNFKKGDNIFAIGNLQSREYQGKTYQDLVLEYASVMPNIEISSVIVPVPTEDFEEIPEGADDEDDLPF